MVLALALVAAVAAGTAGVALSAGGSSTVKTRHTSLGTILTDGKGRTLYLFEKDKSRKSTCAGQCAVNWPPLTTSGKPTAGGGASASKLGTARRSDGRTQVTYGGHPLYRFVADKDKPGSTKGEGIDAFGAEWYVVGTNGKKIEKGGGSSSTPSGY